ALNGIYDDLANRLTDETTLNVAKLYVTEYPDPTRNNDRVPCSAVLDDVIPMATVIAGIALVPILAAAFPWLPTAVLTAAVLGAANGVTPPFGLFGNEVAWAGNTALPSGGANADHGLDRVIADAVQRHVHDRVPWELVGGITEDFQGTGALSNGVGHGYCAPN